MIYLVSLSRPAYDILGYPVPGMSMTFLYLPGMSMTFLYLPGMSMTFLHLPGMSITFLIFYLA